MTADEAPGPLTRRRLLATAGALALGGRAVGRATAADGVDLTEWFAPTDGADAVVDATGRARVDVAVGARGNGGGFAFDPAVVRVDPGTTVVWTWTGEGGSHNVSATDGSFESAYHDATGETYQHTVESDGVIRYECAPHSAMGMRGAVVVGDVAVTLGGSATATPAAPTSRTEPARTFDGWLDGTDNYSGVVDRTGAETVRVAVGADGNGEQFAFEPAAIHVDPGTTVVWEWVGTAGAYDVVDETLGYASEQVRGAGHEFALRFGDHGVSRYECTTYGDRGMRGAVVVGAGPQETLTWRGVGAAGAVGVGLAAPLAYGLRLHERTATTGGE